MKYYSFTDLNRINVSSQRNGDRSQSYILFPSVKDAIPTANTPTSMDTTIEDSSTRILCLNIGIPIALESSLSRLEISVSSFTEEPSERNEDCFRIEEMSRSSTIDESSRNKEIKPLPLANSIPQKESNPSVFQSTVDDWNSEIPVLMDEAKPLRRKTLNNDLPTATTTKAMHKKTKSRRKLVDDAASGSATEPRLPDSRRSLLASTRSVRVRNRIQPPSSEGAHDGRKDAATTTTPWARNMWSSTRMLRGISTRGLGMKKGRLE